MSARKQIHVIWISGSLLLTGLLLQWFAVEPWNRIVLTMAAVIAGWSIAKRAIQAVIMKTFNIELLVTIAVIGALLIGEYIEAAAVTFLFLFGAYLEVRSLEKTRSSLKSLMDMAPLEATVMRGDQRITVPVSDIEKGEHILIRSGETIAVDGKIISGRALINESTITGESVPLTKKQDDSVFSGTLIDNGYIEVIAEKVGDDTAFSKIIEYVEEAQEEKARTQRFLDRFANIYTPGIIVLSIIVLLFTRNIELTLTFLVIACPGALVISAPVSLVAGIGNGAKNGVLIKGGETMENLAKIDTFVFDKTGTLTEGKPSVTNIITYGIDPHDLLKIAAEAEHVSEHHLGRTIIEEAKERGIVASRQPDTFKIVKGHGLTATFGKDTIVIGNRKMLLKHHIKLPQTILRNAASEQKAGHTAVYIAINKEVSGIISIADTIRKEAAEAIKELKASGIEQIIMLTGDNEHVAKKVADQTGVDTVYANALPEDKVKHLKDLQQKGHHVAMVGDGINDTPAIALSHVGIAMGAAGTDAAMETADVVLMGDKLHHIPYAHALSKATIRNMKQNMFFAVGTVALLLTGVLIGKVFLTSGMLIHELSVLAVIVNAMRLIRFKQTKRKKESPRPLPQTQSA